MKKGGELMIIAIDGPVGSGKTSLCTLLAQTYHGIAVRVDPDEQIAVKDKVLSDLVISTSRTRQDALWFFGSEDYNKDGISPCMFALQLARLKLIQSNKHIMSHDYIFVDAFWEGLWQMTEENLPVYFDVLCKFVEPPDMSIFLKVSSQRSHDRRAGENQITIEMSEDEHAAINESKNIFCGWSERHLANFHALDARVPIGEVFAAAQNILGDPPSAPAEPEAENITLSWY